MFPPNSTEIGSTLISGAVFGIDFYVNEVRIPRVDVHDLIIDLYLLENKEDKLAIETEYGSAAQDEIKTAFAAIMTEVDLSVATPLLPHYLNFEGSYPNITIDIFVSLDDETEQTHVMSISTPPMDLKALGNDMNITVFPQINLRKYYY